MKHPNGLYWPPRNRNELKAWLRGRAGDVAVAESVGVTRDAVRYQRQLFNLPPVARRHVDTQQKDWRKMSEGEIHELYAGRKYND